jgi:hypothetical protein
MLIGNNLTRKSVMPNISQDGIFIERYKYVLQRKRDLNDSTFKIVTVYQAGLVLIVSAQYAIFSNVVSFSLDHYAGRLGTIGLMALMGVLSVFSLLLLAGGVAAWRNYQKEEEAFEIDLFDPSLFRRGSRISTWYETYFIIAILIILSIYVFAVSIFILPLLN